MVCSLAYSYFFFFIKNRLEIWMRLYDGPEVHYRKIEVRALFNNRPILHAKRIVIVQNATV